MLTRTFAARAHLGCEAQQQIRFERGADRVTREQQFQLRAHGSGISWGRRN